MQPTKEWLDARRSKHAAFVCAICANQVWSHDFEQQKNLGWSAWIFDGACSKELTSSFIDWGLSNLEKKPSLINFGLSLGLVWLISVALDELSPNLNLFVHILLTIIISSVIWSFVTSFIFIWSENHKFFKRHEEQVNQMV